MSDRSSEIPSGARETGARTTWEPSAPLGATTIAGNELRTDSESPKIPSGAPSGARANSARTTWEVGDATTSKFPSDNELRSCGRSLVDQKVRSIGTRPRRLLTHAGSVPIDLSGCKWGSTGKYEESGDPDFAELARLAVGAKRKHFAVIAGVWEGITGRIVDRKAFRQWFGISKPVRDGLIECFRERRLEWFSTICTAIGMADR